LQVALQVSLRPPPASIRARSGADEQASFVRLVAASAIAIVLFSLPFLPRAAFS
jgi:hypothetical protein